MAVVLVLSVLVLAGIYRLSVWRNPYRPCHWCGGKGKRHGVIFTWSRGYCAGCHGSGWRDRVGARVVKRHR